MFQWGLAKLCVPEAESGVFAGIAEASFSERGLCERILRTPPTLRIYISPRDHTAFSALEPCSASKHYEYPPI